MLSSAGKLGLVGFTFALHEGANGVESFESDTSSDQLAAALRRDGGVIVREQVQPEVADQVLAELRDHFDRVGKRSQGGFNR